jgi:hypothetical protein
MNFWCLFSFCKNTIVITFSLDVSCSFRGRRTITTNVWRLGEGGDLPQMFKRSSHFKFTKILLMNQYTAKFAKLVLNETFGSYLSKKQLPCQN